MKYFIHLSYKGTHYHGWQRQPNHISVQEILENAIEKMMGYKINCIGCGRTDTGVHASQFFCHIKTEKPFDFDPVFRLNKMLPKYISIFDFIPVDKNAHAQHDAISRTYTYRIHTRKNAILSEVSSFYPKENMDIDKIKNATALLNQHMDYRSFCKQPDLYKNTLCKVSGASVAVNKNSENIIFEITANRFLRNMVRLIIGNILEVGYGKISFAEFEAYLNNEEKPKHFNAAYPQGLYLSKVVYPYLCNRDRIPQRFTIPVTT